LFHDHVYNISHALQLYQATPDPDEYEQQGFGTVILLVSALVTGLSIISTFIGTPCIQNCWDKIKGYYATKRLKQTQKNMQTKQRRWSGVNPVHSGTLIEMPQIVNPLKETRHYSEEHEKYYIHDHETNKTRWED
jgi:hypothetical protein